ncbi:MAG TPA: hypothetical protein VFB38_17195 [Chthonomonadaceae bacterium]|nr:hypothetical protein [Chthonomonadaceae bacterium]
MADLEAIYLRMPFFVQNALCNVQGWKNERQRYGRAFPALLREAEERVGWPQEQMIAFRDRRLRAFVQHCARTVPYYQRLFQKLCIGPEEIRTLEDLQRLPILTKDEVRAHSQELISQAVPERERIWMHTSGTTGGGLRFPTTAQSLREVYAACWRYRRWHGLERGTWGAFFAGRSLVPLTQSQPPFWRINAVGRQILFSGYHMSPNNLPAYVAELRRRRPPWLHGYPSLLALLAAYLLDTGQDLGYPVRWITLASESLLPQQAEQMRLAFGVTPRQHYHMTESVAHASECEYGALHVDEDFAAVEFVPNADGANFKVIGTNFTNLAFPLLRYEVQDHVTLGEVACPCGRPGRILADVDGRREDYVLLKNGARLGRLDHIFKDMVHVREAQIVQRQRGQMILRIVRGSGYTQADEARLLEETRRRVGADMDLLVEYSESLPRSRSGKLRFVLSEIQDGQLTTS